jgi:hypothetical protein
VRVFEAPRVQLATGLSGSKERRPLSDGSTIIAPPQAFPLVSSRPGRPQAGAKLAMTAKPVTIVPVRNLKGEIDCGRTDEEIAE